jgi:hypothetical protein
MQTNRNASTRHIDVHKHCPDKRATAFVLFIFITFLFCTILPPVEDLHIPAHLPVGTYYRDKRPTFNNDRILAQLARKDIIRIDAVKQAVSEDTTTTTTTTATQKYIARLNSRDPPVKQFKPTVTDIEHDSKKYFMAIAINTIARKKYGEFKDYIAQTLSSLTSRLDEYYQEPSALYRSKILVFVQDNTDGPNPPFDNLQQTSNGNYDLVLFKNKNRFFDPFDDVPGHNYEAPDNAAPGRKARQQNADVISMSRNILHNFDFEHFMFMEDDFISCPDSISETFRVMKNLIRQYPQYCAVRVTYGMSGVILPRQDLDHYTTYLEHNIDAMPVDILIRWYQFHDAELFGEGGKELPFRACRAADRRSFVYKHILQEHIGAVSTFSERNVPGFRKEFEKCGASTTNVWSNNNEERFDGNRCKEWSLSPCLYLQGPPF